MKPSTKGKRLSIWRPIASAKAIMIAESNVLKATNLERSVIISKVDQRVGGERKDRFYRKSIAVAQLENGISWRGFMGVSLGFLLLTIALIHYEFINLKLVELFELIPTMSQVKGFLHTISLGNFMQTMGELGLKVTHLDK